MSTTKSNKKINSIIILNILGTFIYQGIIFLLTPILTRALGTHDYGLVSIYTTWVNFLYPIIGLSTSAAIPYIKLNIDEENQDSWVSSTIGLTTFSYLIFTSFILVFLAPISKVLGFEPIVVVLMCLHCFGLTLVKFIVAYYIQNQKTIHQFAFTISVSVVSSVLTLGLLYFITASEQKYFAKIVAFSLSYFVAGVVAFCILIFKGKKIFSIKVWKFLIPFSIPMVFHQVSHLILSQSDKVMLQQLVSNGVSLAGIYGFAYTIASIGTVGWTALNNAWSPFYYKMLGENDQKSISNKSNNYISLFTGLYIILLLISPEIALIMGGKEFANSSYMIIPIIHLGNYFIFLYSFSVNFKVVKKLVKSIAIGTIGAAISNISLNLIFIPKYGATAAAFTSLVSYVLLFLFHHFSICKSQQDYQYKISFYLKGIVSILIATAIYYGLLHYFIIRTLLGFALMLYLIYSVIKRKSIF